MPARGRPRLTEDVLRERIADYCARYAVAERNQDGFPAFPTGRRETPQHREWVVLYKALQRLRAREAAVDPDARGALLATQQGRCPVCDKDAGVEDPLIARQLDGAPMVVHRDCRDLVRKAEILGPDALDRLRALLWPARPRRPR